MKAKSLVIFIFFSTIINAQNRDIELLEKININRNAFLDVLNHTLSSSAAIIAIGIAAILLIVAIYNKSLFNAIQALFVGFSVSLSAIVSGLIKVTVNRPRPFDLHPFIEKLSTGGTPSFPSGHTADAFSFATAICIIYPRWYVVIPAYLWAIGVAYSRINS